jgi:hypothetical protein
MKSTIKERFHVSDHNMDKRQPLSRHLGRCNFFIVSMILAYAIQGCKAIGSNMLTMF